MGPPSGGSPHQGPLGGTQPPMAVPLSLQVGPGGPDHGSQRALPPPPQCHATGHEEGRAPIRDHTEGDLPLVPALLATEMIRHGCDVRKLQRLMGHRDIRVTEHYMHVVEQSGLGVRSPLDRLPAGGDEDDWP